MKLPLLVAAAAALALPARAQDAAAPLSRAQSDASALLDAAPARVPGARDTPDDDASVDAKDLTREPLGNFHAVSEGIFRSALPSPEGYKRLKKMGFKTILNLQLTDDEEVKLARPEIRVAHVAMSGLSKPTFAQMDRALAVLASAPRPILVHCAHGKDRTGFVVAAWRAAVEGMPVARAAEEARSYGCCFVLFGDLDEYLRKYLAHRRKAGALARFPATAD